MMDSNKYIKPIYTKIGQYHLSDSLFDDTFLNLILDQLRDISAIMSTDILSNTNDIAKLHLSAGDVLLSTRNLKLSVDDLYSSINEYGNDIEYLSNAISTLNINAIKRSISNVGVLKPYDEHELNLRIDVFSSAPMLDDSKVGMIDLSNSNDWTYFEALLINNGDNSSNQTDNPLSPDYFPGTQWMNPVDINDAMHRYNSTLGFRGYGPAFNNSPVNISFLKWLEDHELTKDLNFQSKFYLRFTWYYIDYSNTNAIDVHFSDHFSMVVPSYAEVGAKAGASVSKQELYEIKQVLETQVVTSQYTNDDDHTIDGYYVQPYCCNILENFINADEKNIILQNYSEGKTYKLKFDVGRSNISIGDSSSSTSISFWIDVGNGPENMSELNSSSIEFLADKTYLIAINLEMIQVIAIN